MGKVHATWTHISFGFLRFIGHTSRYLARLGILLDSTSHCGDPKSLGTDALRCLSEPAFPRRKEYYSWRWRSPV